VGSRKAGRQEARKRGGWEARTLGSWEAGRLKARELKTESEKACYRNLIVRYDERLDDALLMFSRSIICPTDSALR
jgi:hypothetical protein